MLPLLAFKIPNLCRGNPAVYHVNTSGVPRGEFSLESEFGAQVVLQNTLRVGAPGYGVGEELRASQRRLWELSESTSRSFCVVFLDDCDHSFHCPFSCSLGPMPVFSFGDKIPQSRGACACGGGEQDFGFMVGYLNVLW